MHIAFHKRRKDYEVPVLQMKINFVDSMQGNESVTAAIEGTKTDTQCNNLSLYTFTARSMENKTGGTILYTPYTNSNY